MEQIFGTIERITFRQEETGYTVARLKQPRQQTLTTIVGTLPHLVPGEMVRLQGKWKKHASHGLQFDVEACYLDSPKDPAGIEKYLSSGVIRGIGPQYAKRIVDRFKENTLEILEHNPDALLDIEGIGDKRLQQIKKSWGDQQAIRSIMVFLQKHGVSPAYARKIYRQYGQETIERLQENPYALATDISGIGFKIADTIAFQMGFPKTSSLRVDAGISFVLNELATEGHTCFPLIDLCKKAEEILQTPIEERLKIGLEEGHFIQEEDKIWLRKYWLCEKSISHQISRLLHTPSRLRSVDSAKALAWVEEQLTIQLAELQKLAVNAALKEKVLIITGGPGTGKSTITKAILRITEKLSTKILLSAPTGRAAKRMSEITHKEAFTIHALLKFDFKTGRFKHNKQNPLNCDLLIVDEASMIDTLLATSLLNAIASHTRLILVGDVHQLPSVGPGTVLQDLIASQRVAVITLTQIYRQAADSKIITNAHLVNQGHFPDLSFDKNSDFFFCKTEDPKVALSKVVELVSQRLNKRFDPLKHMQVLSPMKKGELGIDNLNLHLQAALNPQAAVGRLCIKDKVMQLRNNYDKEVYNGDMGQVIQADEQVIVDFDGKQVTYDPLELDELTLAYATSIHKFQGSESPCVIIVIHPSHYILLQRNLLYTAITRGKKLVVLVGTGKAIAMAVGRNDVQKRYTGLLQSLQSNQLAIN